jgi:hypothetical protein
MNRLLSLARHPEEDEQRHNPKRNQRQSKGQPDLQPLTERPAAPKQIADISPGFRQGNEEGYRSGTRTARR